LTGATAGRPATSKMTDQPTVERRIAGWFLTTLNVEISSPDMDLFDSGVLDSLGFVELLMYLEQTFDVRIPLEQIDIEDFRSIDRIAAFLVAAPCQTRLTANAEGNV
jgi:D-alanine--poly(phosphoribitol) ligase subunit 2